MYEIPKTMHVAAIDRFGGPEVLTVHTLPVPVPDAREVLIALHTARSRTLGRRDTRRLVPTRPTALSTRARH